MDLILFRDTLKRVIGGSIETSELVSVLTDKIDTSAITPAEQAELIDAVVEITQESVKGVSSDFEARSDLEALILFYMSGGTECVERAKSVMLKRINDLNGVSILVSGYFVSQALTIKDIKERNEQIHAETEKFPSKQHVAEFEKFKEENKDALEGFLATQGIHFKEDFTALADKVLASGVKDKKELLTSVALSVIHKFNPEQQVRGFEDIDGRESAKLIEYFVNSFGYGGKEDLIEWVHSEVLNAETIDCALENTRFFLGRFAFHYTHQSPMAHYKQYAK